MSLSKSALSTAGAAALGFMLGATGLAIAQFGMSGPSSQLGMPQYMKPDTQAVAELGNNEGVYVDRATFKLHMGKPKGNPTSEILRTGAKEVANGAIIFRSDGKLYIVDAKPAEMGN
jgi:hypothetical protein